MLLLQRRLLARLCLRLVLAVGTGQDEALVHVGDVIIIEVLGMVFVQVGACRLLVWRGDK